MTREEVIKILENEKECVKRAEYCDRQCGKCELVKEDKIILKALDMAIKALEQESILDKVRTEIVELDIYYDNDYYSDNKDAMFKCNDVLHILDEYKAESEE